MGKEEEEAGDEGGDDPRVAETYIQAGGGEVEDAAVVENGGYVKLKNPLRFASRIPHSGIILAAVSSFFFSLCSVIVKHLKYMSPPQLATYRFLGMFLPTLVAVTWIRENVFPLRLWWKIILRGLAGSCGIVLQFYAFQFLPLGDASVIIFSLPVFVSIMARIFLKEPCSVLNIVCIVLTTCGVILIIRPPFLFRLAGAEEYTDEDLYGALAALCSLFMASTSYVLIRMLREMHYCVVMFDFSVIGLLCMVAQTAVTHTFSLPRCDWDLLLVFGLATFSFLAQIMFTKSLQIEEAGVVSIARTVDIIFAFVWQSIWFQETPKALSIVGSILVAGSVIVLGLRKWIIGLPEDSKTRRSLRFFMK